MAVVSQPSSRVRTPVPAGTVPRQRGARRPPAAHIRWDRVARLAMLFTLVVLLYLAISPIRSLITDFHVSSQRQAQLRDLERRGAALVRQEQALSQPGMLQIQARNLGLVRRGEHAFVAYGLPDN